ncbi:MAG: glutathione S-transferase family protein [Sandaracinaceae bacterium]
MPHYRLISFKLCPFVQRSVITLGEKGVGFDVEYIDLSNKPGWFLELSPLGKVPVLQVDGDVVLFESAVINEYLDEVTEGRTLPEEPLPRARHRAWIEYASAVLGEIWRMQVQKTEDDTKQHAATVRSRLERLEAELGEGPYFAGATLSLVDAATAPALQRAAWIDELRPELGLLRDLPKVEAWRQALFARPAYRESLVPEAHDLFVEDLRRGESWLLAPSA